MSESAHPGNRLEELESRLAFQDDVVEQLNDVVARQDRLIADLQKRLSDLEKRMESLADAGSAAGAEHEVPPHY